MELLSLLVRIAAENSEANEAIDETSEHASNATETIGNVIKTIGKWGTAIATASIAAATGIAAFATKAASAADNVDKMSQKIGISREAYQELDFICSQSGTSVDILQQGIKQLTNQMQSADSGTKTATETFEKLGISIYDANGKLKDQESMMWETIAALQGLENQTEKSALATDLFGRSGTELMPLLNSASGSIEEMRKQAHDLGLVLSDEVIDNGVNLTDSLDQTKRAFQAIAVNLANSLMPIIEQVSDYVQESIPYIQSLVEEFQPVLTEALEGFIPLLKNIGEKLMPVAISTLQKLIPIALKLGETILPPILDVITELLPIAVQIVSELLPIAIQIIESILPQLASLVIQLLPVLLELFQAILPLIESLVPLLPPILEIIIATIDPLIALLEAIIPIIDIIVQLSTVIITWMVPSFRMWGQILTTVSTLFRTFAGDAKNVWMVVADVVRVGCESIKTLMVGTFNYIEGKVFPIFENIRAGIKKIFTLPKVSISPKGWSANDLLKGKMPSFSVDWYAKAMDEPMIMTRPTAFGMNSNGQIMAGGEAGSEVVSGTNTLMGMISSAVAAQTSRTEEVLMNILELLSVYIPELSRMQMVMDSGVLVGQLAPGIDAELGKLAFRSERGV